MNDNIRLKQLLFRSQHRGFNEMDQLLGAFARTGLPLLNATQLDSYAALLDLPDWDVYAWLVGQSPPPAAMAEIVQVIQAHVAAAGRLGTDQ